MTQISLRADVADLTRQLRQLPGKIRQRVVQRSIKRASAAARTSAVRSIRETYAVRYGDVLRRITVRITSGGELATIEAHGSPGRPRSRAVNVAAFAARAMAAGGVSFKIRKDGGRQHAESWFMLPVGPGSKPLVFRRTGPGRRDIEAVKTIDVRQMFTARAVHNAALERGRSVLREEIRRQMDLLATGFTFPAGKGRTPATT